VEATPLLRLRRYYDLRMKRNVIVEAILYRRDIVGFID
jgi:hypothetical protein